MQCLVDHKYESLPPQILGFLTNSNIHGNSGEATPRWDRVGHTVIGALIIMTDIVFIVTTFGTVGLAYSLVTFVNKLAILMWGRSFYLT